MTRLLLASLLGLSACATAGPVGPHSTAPERKHMGDALFHCREAEANDDHPWSRREREDCITQRLGTHVWADYQETARDVESVETWIGGTSGSDQPTESAAD